MNRTICAATVFVASRVIPLPEILLETISHPPSGFERTQSPSVKLVLAVVYWDAKEPVLILRSRTRSFAGSDVDNASINDSFQPLFFSKVLRCNDVAHHLLMWFEAMLKV